MAGEIEEHFRLDFKADCFHSGSISFGRYESEAALCWERRSSFSHNRILEEVEKCSTPGLVIEKKAYFEAHFKKKGGLLGLCLPKSRTSDNDEEISPSSNLDSRIEYLCDGVDNVDSVSVNGKVEEAHRANLESVISTAKSDTSNISNLTTFPFNDRHEKSDASCNGSSSKEKNSSKHRVSTVAQGRRCITIDKATQDLRKKSSKAVNNVLTRPKSDNKTSKASPKDERPKQDQPGKKANGVKEIKRGETQARNTGTEVLRKLPSRVQNRIKSSVSASQESSGVRFKCNERERRREFDMKIEERMRAKKAEMHQLQEKSEAEAKKLRQRLNFKAKPLPSFYLRDLDGNKIKSPRTGSRASRLSSKSSKHEACVPPKTLNDSGGTSCHSTVTSDSSPSSPSAVITNRGGSKGNTTSLLKHKKASQGNKKMDGKQKKTTIQRGTN